MLLLYCQHWHFNSVIENYISGKLVCTVACCLMTVINQPSSFRSRCYRIASYNVGSLGAILVVFTFLNSWQGSHLTAQMTFASLKAQHYVKLLCTTPNRPLSTSKFYVDFKNFFPTVQKMTLAFLFSMFFSLSGISLIWKTLVFGCFTSQKRTNVHRTAFFLHTPDFLLSKVTALKVVCGKDTSRRSKEPGSDLPSCFSAWAPFCKCGWRHHVSRSSCGPDWWSMIIVSRCLILTAVNSLWYGRLK